MALFAAFIVAVLVTVFGVSRIQGAALRFAAAAVTVFFASVFPEFAIGFWQGYVSEDARQEWILWPELAGAFAGVVIGLLPLLKKKYPGATEQSPVQQTDQPIIQRPAGSPLIGGLRIIRGFCGFLFAWQIVGLLPLLTMDWNQPIDRDGLIVLSGIKLIAVVLFGGAFFWLRTTINNLYIKKHGFAHPVLRNRAWAL